MRLAAQVPVVPARALLIAVRIRQCKLTSLRALCLAASVQGAAKTDLTSTAEGLNNSLAEQSSRRAELEWERNMLWTKCVLLSSAVPRRPFLPNSVCALLALRRFHACSGCSCLLSLGGLRLRSFASHGSDADPLRRSLCAV